MAGEISTQLNKVQAPQVATDAKKNQPLVPTSVYGLSEPLKTVEEKSDEKDKLEITAEKIRAEVTQLNEHMQNLNRSLQFSVDEKSGDSIITVRDAETEEVIRQFPSDELLKARNSIDTVKGLLIKVDA